MQAKRISRVFYKQSVVRQQKAGRSNRQGALEQASGVLGGEGYDKNYDKSHCGNSRYRKKADGLFYGRNDHDGVISHLFRPDHEKPGQSGGGPGEGGTAICQIPFLGGDVFRGGIAGTNHEVLQLMQGTGNQKETVSGIFRSAFGKVCFRRIFLF